LAPCRGGRSHRRQTYPCTPLAHVREAGASWHRCLRSAAVPGAVCRRRAILLACYQSRLRYNSTCHQPRCPQWLYNATAFFTKRHGSSHSKARGVTLRTRCSCRRAAGRPAIRRRRATVSLVTLLTRTVARPIGANPLHNWLLDLPFSSLEGLAGESPPRSLHRSTQAPAARDPAGANVGAVSAGAADGMGNVDAAAWRVPGGGAPPVAPGTAPRPLSVWWAGASRTGGRRGADAAYRVADRSGGLEVSAPVSAMPGRVAHAAVALGRAPTVVPALPVSCLRWADHAASRSHQCRVPSPSGD
jgi:hypothetical protein